MVPVFPDSLCVVLGQFLHKDFFYSTPLALPAVILLMAVANLLK